MPGLELGHFRAKLTARLGELSLLGVERDSSGPKRPAPKGLENLAQGLPWVFGLMPQALKGRPLTRRRGSYPEMPVAPSGLLTTIENDHEHEHDNDWRRGRVGVPFPG